MSVHFKYEKLFSVETEDATNASLKTDVFRYTPTKACTKILNKYGFVYNTFTSGFAVYYKVNKTRPVSDQLTAEIQSRLQLQFNFKLSDPQASVQYKKSFEMVNGPQFYMNNLNGTSIKPNGAVLHLEATLGNKDNLKWVPVQELGALGTFTGKRLSDPLPLQFDLSTKNSTHKPFGVIDIIIEDSQKTFNNTAYLIKLKAS